MKQYKQLTQTKDIVGKTIVAYKHECGDLYVKFDDDTFVCLTYEGRARGFGIEPGESAILASSYVLDEDDEILLEFGFITKHEHEEVVRIAELRREEERRIQREEHKKRTEAAELKQLEELKKKYEK